MHRFAFVLTLVAAACGDNIDGNSPPTITDVNVTTDEDTPVTRPLDLEAQGVPVIMLGTPAHGTVTLTGTSFTYTPEANYNGTDAFSVTVSDDGGQAEAAVNITITAVNDPPMAVADSFATNEDVPHEAELTQLAANDTDVDGDTLTVTAVSSPTNGTVISSAGDAVFTPASNFTGNATYRYTVSDGTATAEGTVTITVGGVNDAPTAVNDTRTTAEDVDLVVTGASLVANDTDPDGQTLTVTAVSNATNGSVTLTAGSVTFAPVANFNGTATFDYTVSDGAATDTGTVTVTVTAVNDAPVAVDDAASADQDTPRVIPASQLLANDTDIDTAAAGLSVSAVANATNGTVSLTGTDITFTPASGFTGSASFEYTLSDGALTDTGLVTVTVSACVPVDDGVPCTMDICQNGQPVSVPNHLSCEVDGFACTVPTCSATTGCSETPTNAACSDSATCTTDVCSPTAPGANGAGCIFTPDNTVCNDSLTCTTDACAPGTGGADPTTGCTNTSTCNDNIACTEDSCGAGGCVFTPNNALCPTAGDVCVAGSGCRTPPTALLITELGILGSGTSEMIELFNSGAAAALDGVTISNMAGQTVTIRPANDPTGTLGIQLSFAAGAFAWGVPNPANAGDIPAGATFVYGDPGTTFSFADTGDMVVITGQDTTVLDTVDFTLLEPNPDVSPSATEFVAIASRSTQLDVSAITAGAASTVNDAATAWCTTFRTASTRGATNQSCSALVINEVYYDHDNPTGGTDDRFTFIELAGPGGASIGGFRLQGLDGATGVTTNQEPQITFTAGLRTPANGFFVAADVVSGTTNVPNADLLAAVDPQNDNDAIILRDASATPVTIDLVCYGTGAAAAQCEGSPARDLTPDRIGFALARDASSTDTNANATDFQIDVSPTPGTANDGMTPAITAFSPNDGLASGGTVVTIQARDFADISNAALADNDVSATFVDVSTPDTTNQSDSCLLVTVDFATGAQTITCTSPARAAGPITGDFVLTNPADVGGSVTVANGWTYTGELNESDTAAEADFCRTNTLAATATSGMATSAIEGQIFEAGRTDTTVGSAAPGILAEVGFGTLNSDPTNIATWNFTSITSFTGEGGTNNNDDLYTGTFVAPVVTAVTTFSYVYRFSFDNGLNWTYCDGDGAGSNALQDFSTATMGVLTVSP